MNSAKQIDPVEHLISVDPVLAKFIHKIPRPKWNKRTNYFQSLATGIISQQLSIKAADTITGRFIALFSNTQFPKPEEIIKLSDNTIRASGLSYAKISYIKDLSRKVCDESLRFDELDGLSDDEVVAKLRTVKGIGVWTAEMFLMFSLGRKDIFSYADLGLRNGMKKIYKLSVHPTKEEAEKISAKWKPYRSWASRYLWATLDM